MWPPLRACPARRPPTPTTGPAGSPRRSRHASWPPRGSWATQARTRSRAACARAEWAPSGCCWPRRSRSRSTTPPRSSCCARSPRPASSPTSASACCQHHPSDPPARPPSPTRSPGRWLTASWSTSCPTGTPASQHALGHRRIGVLVDRIAADAYRGPVDDRRLEVSGFRAARLRLAGYADAVQAADLAWAAVPIQECGVPNRASGYAGATALLERAPELTAILATTDLLALGAVEAARQRDLPVAGALSIVGFDDLPDAAGAELTTVHQPLTGKGRIAAHMLQQALDGAAVIPSRVELSTRLIVRASTGRPTSKSPL